MNNVNNWQLLSVEDIKWVPGLLFKREERSTLVFKIVGHSINRGCILWDYADAVKPMGTTTPIRYLSQKKYWVKLPSPPLTKEESVIKKIKELNLRYANRGASIRLGNNG